MREPDHAAELQDHVVNAIFAVGLHLQSTAEIAADPLVRRRVEEALSDLDDLVCMIRDTVFRLDDRGQRAGIMHVCGHPRLPTPPSPAGRWCLPAWRRAQPWKSSG